MLNGCVNCSLPGTEVRITRNCWRETPLTRFGQTWHANESEQLRISRATSGLPSLWIHSNLHLCLCQCSPEADPRTGCYDFWGKAAWASEQKRMYCNRTNASDFLFPEPLFKEKKMFTFKSSSLFYCHMQNPLTVQQDRFHTLCAHRLYSCSFISWLAHEACAWSAVHGHTASQTVPSECAQVRDGSTALRAPLHGSLRAAGSNFSV